MDSLYLFSAKLMSTCVQLGMYVYTQHIAVDICRWKGSRLMNNTWGQTLNLHSCRPIVIFFNRFGYFILGPITFLYLISIPKKNGEKCTVGRYPIAICRGGLYLIGN